MTVTFSKTLWRQITARPRNRFLKLPDSTLSYQQLEQGIRSWCAVFDRQSITGGERIVIVCEDEVLAGSVFLAALLDGKVPVMLNPQSSVERLCAICSVTEPALLVVENPETQSQLASHPFPMLTDFPAAQHEKRGLLNRIKNVVPSKQRRQAAGQDSADITKVDLIRNLQRQPGLVADSDALAYLLFTSGTTGEPSGVEITHGALQAHMATLTRLFDYNSHSCIANPTPLSHTDGLTQGLLLSASNGACLLRPGRFALDKLEPWLDQFSHHGVSHFITNPTTLSLIDRYAQHDDYFSFDGFKAVISSASVLRNELWTTFEKRFHCRLYNLYGMTETVANATYAGRHPEMGKPGSIGLPIDCEARIVDPADPQSPTNGTGELQLRGTNICRGYWRNAQRNNDAFLKGGWFRTGDLVKQDVDGNLQYVGRLKSMINTGGLSVAPEEIDEALLRHPDVVESVTVGMPHPEFEEIAVSAVVLKSDSAQSLAQEQLLAHARQYLEPLKVPKQIVQLDHIPRSGAGKPDLNRLKALLQETGGEEVARETAGRDNRVAIEEVLELAARVFNIDPATLSAETSPATLQAWDSFNHLTLILEAERSFGLTIPTAAIASIGSLKELHETICA